MAEMVTTNPPRNAPTGFRVGRATVASASLRGVLLKGRVAFVRIDVERRLRAPIVASLPDIVDWGVRCVRLVLRWNW